MLIFKCTCGKQFAFPDDMLGRTGKCRNCGAILTIKNDPEPETDEDVVILAEEPTPSEGTTDHRFGSDAPLPQTDRQLKACPYCAEMIQVAAIKCRFCHEMLNKEGTSIAAQTIPSAPRTVKEIRACIHKGVFAKLWGTLALKTDRVTFTGETGHSDDVAVGLVHIIDVNDRRDGGQEHLIIRYKATNGQTYSLVYGYPSTFGERMSTPHDRRTSWSEWVRIMNDMVIQAKLKG